MLRDPRYEKTINESDFQTLWQIVIQSNSLTGAALIVENEKLRREFINFKMNRDENIETYNIRFTDIIFKMYKFWNYSRRNSSSSNLFQWTSRIKTILSTYN